MPLPPDGRVQSRRFDSDCLDRRVKNEYQHQFESRAPFTCCALQLPPTPPGCDPSRAARTTSGVHPDPQPRTDIPLTPSHAAPPQSSDLAAFARAKCASTSSTKTVND
jgi:hypothetical protein